MENNQNWETRSVIVTGGNKGIGLATVELLLTTGNYSKVIFTARSKDKAESAVAELKTKINEDIVSSKVSYLLLDYSETKSIDAFIQEVKEKHSQVDTHISNAGIKLAKPNSKEVLDSEFFINYTQTKYLVVNFLKEKALRKNGKVICTSSISASMGTLKKLNPDFHAKVEDYEKLSFPKLNELVEEYKGAVLEEENGQKWPSIYATSKMFLSIFVYLLGQQEEVQGANVQVYAVHPGFILTDLTQYLVNKGVTPPETLEDGAEKLCSLAHLPFQIDAEIQGRHFQDGKVVSLRNEYAK